MSKSTRQKARSSPTQTWIPLGKLETIYNFAASLCCTTQSLLRTILDQGSWSLSQSCNSCAATFALEIWDGMRQNRLLRWLPRHAKQSLLGGWRRTWNQCHFPWNVKLIKQLHKHNTKLDFLCELVALGKTKQLQSRSTTSHDWNKVALTFNNQNYQVALQPTYWECHRMIACTHHATFWCVETSCRSLCSSFDWACLFNWQTAGIWITGSHILSLGLKMHWSKSVKSFGCNQRS